MDREDRNEDKKVMGMEDIIEEEKKSIPPTKKEVIVRFTFPKSSFERAKRHFEEASKDQLREVLKYSNLSDQLPKQIEERLVDDLKSADPEKLAISALAITSVQSSQTGITIDIYKKKGEEDEET